MEIRALREDDQRSDFRSGNDSLDRFFREESAQGQGLGSQLLRLVLQQALGMDEKVGCAGVVVDAKPEAVDFYRAFGFIMLDAVQGLSDARPRPRAMFLAIRAIGEAARGVSAR